MAKPIVVSVGGRKSPLNRAVKIAPDEETAMGIAKNLIEANIKKGWDEV
jgi:hypothetical protein